MLHPKVPVLSWNRGLSAAYKALQIQPEVPHISDFVLLLRNHVLPCHRPHFFSHFHLHLLLVHTYWRSDNSGNPRTAPSADGAGLRTWHLRLSEAWISLSGARSVARTSDKMCLRQAWSVRRNHHRPALCCPIPVPSASHRTVHFHFLPEEYQSGKYCQRI